MAALTFLVKLTSTIFDLFVTRSLSTTNGGVSKIQSSANLSDGKGPGSRNFQWVFVGVCGVGEGTYASRLCNLLGVSHVAIGDLVWHELACKGIQKEVAALSTIPGGLPGSSMLSEVITQTSSAPLLDNVVHVCAVEAPTPLQILCI
ncbi:adenylate kinase 1, chloroplastic-like protein [Tanacetum coccineum]